MNEYLNKGFRHDNVGLAPHVTDAIPDNRDAFG